MFGGIEGEKLKTAPRDFPKDHPEIEWLKHKSFLAVKNISEEEMIKEDFLDQAVEHFKAVKPLKDFLNEAVDE